MSVEAVQAVLKESKATHGARLALIVLAEHARSDGSESYPGLAVLMREAKLGRTAVYGAVAELQALKEIEATGKRGRATVWRIVLPSLKCRNPDGKVPESGRESAGIRTKNRQGTTQEPKEFVDWLSLYSHVTGHSVPKLGTKARSRLLAKYRRFRTEEQHSATDMQLAIIGAHANEYRRTHGYDKLPNILVLDKIAGLIDDGRREQRRDEPESPPRRLPTAEETKAAVERAREIEKRRA